MIFQSLVFLFHFRLSSSIGMNEWHPVCVSISDMSDLSWSSHFLTVCSLFPFSSVLDIIFDFLSILLGSYKLGIAVALIRNLASTHSNSNLQNVSMFPCLCVRSVYRFLTSLSRFLSRSSPSFLSWLCLVPHILSSKFLTTFESISF